MHSCGSVRATSASWAKSSSRTSCCAAIAGLRLTPPRAVDRDALDRARERHANVDQRVPAWLAQLDVSDAEQRALGVLKKIDESRRQKPLGLT